jgi:hypothetical protein
MIRKGYHGFELPEDAACESMIKMFDRDNFPVFPFLQKGLDMFKVKGLPEMVDTIETRRIFRFFRKVTELDDSLVLLSKNPIEP